jgi:hypothetical protein
MTFKPTRPQLEIISELTVARMPLERIGEMMAETERHPPGPDKRIGTKSEPIPLPPTLAEIG